MKIIPMLFNAEMVNALLDGRKTQTRRIAKTSTERAMKGPVVRVKNGAVSTISFAAIAGMCPFGNKGDFIYVRETFQPIFAEGFDHGNEDEPDYKTGYGYSPSYPATDGITEFETPEGDIVSRCIPSIHMPRWASRITLQITSVRAEQLQNISEEDAKAEGVDTIKEAAEQGLNWCSGPKTAFRFLWQAAYSAESWDANPWVWVIEFEVIKANIDTVLKEPAA